MSVVGGIITAHHRKRTPTMTITWSPYLLVYADDKDDQEQAADGHSRFGAYLAECWSAACHAISNSVTRAR